MARSGWLGLQLPRFTSRPETVAVVLSGGGARASFQIGSLEYLYDHVEDFTPSLFVGASAGSILAAGLAQYEDRVRQREFVRKVGDIWAGMRRQEDMFVPRPWFAKLKSQAPTLMELMTASVERAKPLFPFLRNDHPEAPLSPPSPTDPLELALTPDEDYQPEWSLGVIAGMAGHLNKLPRLGTDLAAIRHGFEKTRSMYRPGPMLQQLLDPAVFDPQRVAESSTSLRIAMVALESGQLRFMRGDGVICDRDDQPIDEPPHDLTTGILASCSIPGVYRAVPLGQETYVDGGVRENLPAEVAIGHLKPDRTYALVSGSVGATKRASMQDADIFSVVMRSTEILIDEAARDEIAYAYSSGAVVVAPELDVHDAMTVRRGLIQINKDYGWARAAIAHRQPGLADVMQVEEAFRRRLRAYRFERLVMQHPEDFNVKLRLASAKRDFKESTAKCNPHLLPPGGSDWWARWELHANEPPEQPFWL